MLKMIGVKLELLTGIDKDLFIQKGTTGSGISNVAHK